MSWLVLSVWLSDCLSICLLFVNFQKDSCIQEIYSLNIWIHLILSMCTTINQMRKNVFDWSFKKIHSIFRIQDVFSKTNMTKKKNDFTHLSHSMKSTLQTPPSLGEHRQHGFIFRFGPNFSSIMFSINLEHIELYMNHINTISWPEFIAPVEIQWF